jgi:hypothetical protein
MDETMRGRAVALARLGFKVFRLKPNSKVPAVEKFYEAATSDPARVYAAWTDPVSGDSTHENVGVLTGEGLLVADIDCKNGRPGLESLEALEELGLDAATYRVRTASGGIHIYLAIPPNTRIANAVDKPLPGVDIRGWHGFVVGAGSEINGVRYVEI